MKKARPPPPPPPAPPDSAEEPFWNVNWKHFPPRRPHRGRARGSAPPCPPATASEPPQSGSFLPATAAGGGGGTGRGQSEGLTEAIGKARTAAGCPGGLAYRQRRRPNVGSTRRDCPHHAASEGGLCGRAAPKAGPHTPARAPGSPTPHRGLPHEGPWSSGAVFLLKSCKRQLSPPLPPPHTHTLTRNSSALLLFLPQSRHPATGLRGPGGWEGCRQPRCGLCSAR